MEIFHGPPGLSCTRIKCSPLKKKVSFEPLGQGSFMLYSYNCFMSIKTKKKVQRVIYLYLLIHCTLFHFIPLFLTF